MSYELTIEPLGQTIEIEDGQTILDAALLAGIYLPHRFLKQQLTRSAKAKLRNFGNRRGALINELPSLHKQGKLGRQSNWQRDYIDRQQMHCPHLHSPDVLREPDVLSAP